MKVDVITRHSVPNYGSLLQSYATQKILESMGFESEIIDYTRYEERYNNLVNVLIKGKKWDKNIFMRSFYKMIQMPNYSKMYKKFQKYRKDFLKMTKTEYGSLEELKDNLPEADVYCSGSDQIWGKIGTAEYDEAYFLCFVNDDKRCIAYSSSFGKEKISQTLEKQLNTLLKKYDEILVREDTAKKIIKEHGFNNVEQVLDPTFLLNKEQWSELADKAKKTRKKYILVYQLHDNKKFDRYAKNFSKKTGLKLLRISPSIYHMTRSGKLVYLPNQYEFLSLFKNAEYILTDSFHATVFSIIFNKRFVDILPGKTSTRIVSILNLVGLQDRILQDYDDFSFINREIDFSNCNEIIDIERQKSLKLFKKAILGKEKKTIDLMNKHYKCTGCETCKNVCPVKAIGMIENDEGFLEPVVDYKKCVDCGLCSKKCPQLNDIEVKRSDSPIAYAVKNKNLNEQLKSSSGGAFSVLANEVLEKKGTIYGAAFDENLKLEHVRVDNCKELSKLRGSKYVQSKLENVYENIKRDLKEGKFVLFVGTPCQVAGIKSYFENQYENLLLIDLVCHGVPSQKLFSKYIKWLENKNKSTVEIYEFRNKEKNKWGWTSKIKVKFKNGKEKYISAKLDPYYKSFGNETTYREVCYDCKYSNINRMGDITIGDYWGIEKIHPEFYDENGVSAVIVNTEKGKKFFSTVKNKIEYIETDIEKIKIKNNNLKEPTKRKVDRNCIYDGIDDIEFGKYSKKKLNFKKEYKDILKNMIPVYIKKELKKYVKNK